MPQAAYTLIVEPPAPEDGGGFVTIVPDLPGCTSDGESAEEAVLNVQDAIGRPIPAPRRHLAVA